jgi:(S)-ureidoglycine---glyoxylate transaminase
VREYARLLLEAGIPQAVERYRLHGRAMVAGLGGLGLQRFGDQSVRMNNDVGVYVPSGIDPDGADTTRLTDYGIEIGTSFERRQDALIDATELVVEIERLSHERG